MTNYREILYTSTAAAEFLHMSPSSLKRLVAEGIIPARKTFGGHYRFDRVDLDIFLNEYLNKKWASK